MCVENSAASCFCGNVWSGLSGEELNLLGARVEDALSTVCRAEVR